MTHQEVVEAIVAGDTEAVLTELSGNPALALAVLRSHSGETALHIAAWFGRRELVEALVAAGADVNAMSAMDNTPADTAWQNEQHDIVEFLRSHGGRENWDM